MKVLNHFDLFLSRIGILRGFERSFIDFKKLWLQLRFNPVSPIAEREVSSLSFSIALKQILNDLKIHWVFDVGANEGQFRNLLRRLGYAERIISFEPNSKVFEKTLTIEDDHWQRLNFGLGAEETEVDLNICVDSTLSSIYEFEKSTILPEGTEVISRERIKIKRLDKLMGEDFSNIDLSHTILKIDTQGNDLDVLIGMGAYLDKVRVVIFEGINYRINSRVPDFGMIFTFLDKKDFKLRAITPVAMDGSSLIEFDVIMTKNVL